MAARFVTIDRETPMLMPPNMCEWVPEDDLACKFRRENFEAVSTAFLEVLKRAHELRLLKVGTVSVDGTHIKANASKFHAVSYERACELEQQLELEIADLMGKAELADSLPVDDGQRLPEELAHREALRAKVAEARSKLEKRATARATAEQDEYERKVRERAQRPGERKGPIPKPPSPTPIAKEQVNMTDEDSRIMRKSKKSEYQQACQRGATQDHQGPKATRHAGKTRHRRWPGLVRQEETDGRAGVRRHQASHELPTVPAPWT